ncbi:MAG: CBS domain-containing protein [Thermomicrobiales bacterium]|nr:MAG: CBS domain-containing protein [Thermomicrobiales bacterium]
MVGPRISYQLLGVRFTIGAIDIVLAVLILFGVLRERIEPPANPALIAAAGVILGVLVFTVSALSERLRMRLARIGPAALPMILSAQSACGPNVAEARSSVRAARAGLAGMGIDLAIGLIAIAVYLLVEASDRRIGDIAAVGAIAIGGSAGLRFLAAPSLNGGRVARWMLSFTLDDDEDALRGTRVLGYIVAGVLFITGIILLAAEGEAGFWGVAIAAVGIDLGVLSSLATRQTYWLQTAGERTVGQLLEAPHAVVSAANPLDEMVAVLTVDGPSALAVVRDEIGNVVGIMQFQQMRAGVGHFNSKLTIGDVMIPITELPRIEADASLLEAARVLLESGSPAVRFENTHGKTVIATARDIGLPR